MLDRVSVLWWNEVQKDLYTDKDGRTFGVELDLFNNHMSFYIRNPDGGEIPIFTNNVYQAIDVFNHLTKENTNEKELEEIRNRCSVCYYGSRIFCDICIG